MLEVNLAFMRFGYGWRKKLSKLLKIISAHTGLRAFQEFTDSFHNSFHWLTADTQGEQTSLTALVVLTYPGQDRAGKHFGLRLVSPPSSSREQQGAGERKDLSFPGPLLPF